MDKSESGRGVWILGPKAWWVNYPFSAHRTPAAPNENAWRGIQKGIANFPVLGHFVRRALYFKSRCSGRCSTYYQCTECTPVLYQARFSHVPTDSCVWALFSCLDCYTGGTNTWGIGIYYSVQWWNSESWIGALKAFLIETVWLKTM